MIVRSIARLALAAFALAACGGRATSPDPDGGSGDDASDAGDASVAATGSFTVTATLSLTPTAGQGSWANFPKTHTFTMFVDVQTLGLVAGAFGQGTAVALSRTGADAYTTTAAVSLPTSFGDACDSKGVMYDEISFSIVGGRLTGTGRGNASYFSGDVGWVSAATATFVGVPDVDAPTILLPTETIEPMGSALFSASEPLAESAASLIGADGDVFALGAQISDGLPRFTTGFVRSSLMLNWGTTYEITTEALTDFAGNMGSRAGRPKVATPPAPPLAAEDGFESVQSATFGGAGVLPAGPLATTKSLIVAGRFGTASFPNAGSSVALRLAVNAGDTVVRFAVRLVAPSLAIQPMSATFQGDVRVGVPGREVNVVAVPPGKDLVQVTGENASTFYLSPVTTIEVPLPTGTNPEVSFQIAQSPAHCGPPHFPIAVIIDDLRVE